MDYSEKLTRDNSVVILVDFLDGFFPGIKTIDHELLRRNARANRSSNEGGQPRQRSLLGHIPGSQVIFASLTHLKDAT